MKEFKKSQGGFFICEECQTLHKNKVELAKHINRMHNGQKEYYDKWLKEGKEGFCQICNKETEFTGFKKQYKKCCSKECSIQYTSSKTQATLLKKYGSKSAFGSCEIRNKSKKTKKEKYGNEYFTNPEKTQATLLKKYGVNNISKFKKTKEN
jgi:hypothetical protein